MSILKCGDCGHVLPHFVFSGDTDMVTDGLASLSSLSANEIVVTELDPGNFSGRAGRKLEASVNGRLERDDLRFVHFLRAEQVEVPKGVPFQVFRKSYCPPMVFYVCPNCAHGEATEVQVFSPSGYCLAGGKLTVMGSLEIRD